MVNNEVTERPLKGISKNKKNKKKKKRDTYEKKKKREKGTPSEYEIESLGGRGKGRRRKDLSKH